MLRRVVVVSLALCPTLLAAQQQPLSAGAHYYDDFSKYTNGNQLTSGRVGPGLFWDGKNHDMGAKPPANLITYDAVEKAMRYDWPARPTAACNVEQTVGMMPRWYPPPAGMKDLWVRFTTKESPNFEHGRSGCGGRSYKFFLIQFESGQYKAQGRVGTYLGDASTTSPLPTNLWMDMNSTNSGGVGPTNAPIGGDAGWGGQYHTWVIGLEGITTPNATFSVYLDGKLVKVLSNPFLIGQTLGPGWAITFEMGANINNGPDHTQSRWWKEFGVYTTKPSLAPLGR